MKQWYTFYSGASERLAQLGRELPQIKLQQLGGEFQVVENEDNTKLHQAGGEIGRAGTEKREEIGEDEILKIPKR